MINQVTIAVEMRKKDDFLMRNSNLIPFMDKLETILCALHSKYNIEFPSRKIHIGYCENDRIIELKCASEILEINKNSLILRLNSSTMQ